jgi:YhcH/YjgK/YiaL family protein
MKKFYIASLAFTLMIAAIDLKAQKVTTDSSSNLEILKTKIPSLGISKKTAKKWIKKREWNSTRLNVQPSVNAIEFYMQYHRNPGLWQKVFTWLSNINIDTLPAGKYPIDGDAAFASITEGPTNEFNKTTWESHRNYTDLQYIIKGREKIGVSPVNKAAVTKPYSDKRDVANYRAEGSYHTAMPGIFYLFFPQDAHRPGIKVSGYPVVKKLVIKIHTS